MRSRLFAVRSPARSYADFNRNTKHETKLKTADPENADTISLANVMSRQLGVVYMQTEMAMAE